MKQVLIILGLLAFTLGLQAQKAPTFTVTPPSPNNADAYFQYDYQGEDIFGEAFYQWHHLNDDITCGARKSPALQVGQWKMWKVNLMAVTVDTLGAHPYLYESPATIAISGDTCMIYHKDHWSWYSLKPSPDWSYLGASYECVSEGYDMQGQLTYNEATRKLDMVLGWQDLPRGESWSRTAEKARYAVIKVTFFLPIDQYPAILTGTSFDVQDYVHGYRLRDYQRWFAVPSRFEMAGSSK